MVSETLFHIHENLNTSSSGKVNHGSLDVSDAQNHKSKTSFLFEEPFLALCRMALFDNDPQKKDTAWRSVTEQLSIFEDPDFVHSMDIRLRPLVIEKVYENQNQSFYFTSWNKPSVREKMEVSILTSLASNLGTTAFAEMIMKYVRNFDSYQTQFQQHALPLFQQRFRSDIQKLIDSGVLPISMRHVETTIRSTRVVIFDVDEFGSDPDAIGAYFVEDSTIVLKSRYPLSYRLYVHEMMHALAGLSVQKENNTLDQQEWPSIHHIRQGVRYATGLKISRFDWLDEAITESLAISLLGASDSPAYPEERQLYEKLLEFGGIDRAVFTAAYFENFDSEKEGRERNPTWRKLQQAIDHAYCPGFLTKLDKYIQRYGISETLCIFSENWRVIAQVPPPLFTLLA